MMAGPSEKNAGQSEFVAIGKVTRPHGIRGAIRVEPFSHSLALFQSLQSFYLDGHDDAKILYHVTRIQVAGKQIIVTMQECTTRNQAETLRNRLLEVPRDEAIELSGDDYFDDELIGFQVITRTKQPVGVLEEIMKYPANDIFVVKLADKQVMIPAVDEFITNIDKKQGVITIDPIEGLLEYS